MSSAHIATLGGFQPLGTPASQVRVIPEAAVAGVPQFALFVSYAEADEAWVEGYLLDALAQAGVRYHTEAAFDLGAPRLTEFEEAVQQSARTLLVLSPAYLTDDVGPLVNLLAQSYGLETATWPVIPLLLHPVDLPPRLAMLTALDATDPAEWPAALARLCAALQQPLPAAEATSRPACPYPGMVPFREEDSSRFFGRDGEVSGALECLRAHPFLTIIGPSGSGKSSLAFAGLVPALRRSALFGAGEWLVRSFRPGAAPLTALRTAIGGDPNDAPGTVAKLLAAEPAASRLLLIVDQFEEVFTVAAEDARRFEEALCGLANAPGCFLVLTVRADFYPELMASSLWHDIQAQRLEVTPLGEDGLRQAIVQPAEAVGVYVEAALVERLVADAAGEPGVLPLVQETLVLLWERLERRFLPLTAYEALVLPRSSYGPASTAERTGLQVAMARRADGALADLSEAQRPVARRIFLRLVQFGEGRADTRRQQPVAALRATTDDPALFDPTLDHLAGHRLLTLGGDERGGRTVDIAHEALIHGWPCLDRWLTERREAEQIRRRLETKADEWVRLGRGTAGLLDAVELAEGNRWLEGPDAVDLGHGEALPALVQASREAAEEARRRDEAIRARELEQARALAASGARRAREQSRAAARQRIWFMVAGILAVVTTTALVAALLGRTREEAERARAEVAQEQADLQARVAQTVAHANDARLQLSLHQDKQAALSVLQAYRLNGGTKGAARGAVDEALRAVLAEPNFASILDTGAAVDAVAFSPDGETLLTGDREGSLQRWTMAETGAVADAWPAHDWVSSVAFSPDGKRVASGGHDRTVRLWDVSASPGTAERTLDVEFRVSSVAFGVIGPSLAAAGDNGAVLVWNLANIDAPPVSLPSGASAVQSLAFAPDGQTLAAAGFGTSTLQLWDLARPTAPPTDLSVPMVTFESVAFDAGGRLAAGGSDGVVRYWQNGPWLEPALLTNPEDSDAIVAVAFHPDGTTLAAAHGRSGNTWLWDLGEGRIVGRLHGHGGVITSLAFDDGGRALATGGGDNTVRVWDIGAPPTPNLLYGHAAEVWAVAYGPDGRLLASGDRTGRLLLWDTHDLTAPARPLVGHSAAITSIAVNPTGTTLASGSSDGAVLLWSLANPSEPHRLLTGAGAVTSLAYSGDGRWLAASRATGVVSVWNADGSGEWPSLRSDEGTIQSVAFSPDSTILAAGGCVRIGALAGSCGRGGILVWETADLTKRARTLVDENETATDPITAIAFRPDATNGSTLAVGGADGTVRLWAIDEGAGRPVVLPGPRSPVTTVLFDSNGSTLAAGHRNGAISVWTLGPDASTTGAPNVLAGHAGAVRSVTFPPDGRSLASAGDDRLVRIWLVHTEDLKDLVCQRIWRDLTVKEREPFLADAEPTCSLPQADGGMTAAHETDRLPAEGRTRDG